MDPRLCPCSCPKATESGSWTPSCMAANRYWGFGLIPALNSFVAMYVIEKHCKPQLPELMRLSILPRVVGDPACARQPDLARAVNLQASLALIEECQRAGVYRFVFASTCSNYGQDEGCRINS